MKRLWLLLPVYLLFLACTPCTDMPFAAEQEQVATAAGTDEHDTDAETCSPFCVCNCCGQRVPGNHLISVSDDLLFPAQTKQAPLPTFSLQDVLQHIWQPPQLI